MADRTYEVRINGLVSTEELLEELRDVRVAEHEFRTVLSGRFVDQAELYAFLNRLRSYGLEVVEVRRVARAPRAGKSTEGRKRPMSPPRRPRRGYELTVVGGLGPGAACDGRASRDRDLRRHTIMCLRAQDDEDLVDVRRLLGSRGLEITNISTIH